MTTCLYCGADGKLVNEHLVPRSRGGRDTPENIFRACPSCNGKKKDRLPSEWRSDLPASVYDLERIAISAHSGILPRTKNTKPLKQKVIRVQCTEAQKTMLTQIAANKGVGVSTWLLQLGLVDAEKRRELQQ